MHAFTQLVEAFDRDLLRLAFLIAGSTEAAEDAVQGAWTRLWSQPPRLEDPSRIRSWLLTVAANEARQDRRRRGRGAELESIAPNPSIRDLDPRLADLAAIVSGLDDGDRELLALRFAVGLTSQEIGDQLGLSAEGTRSRLRRLLGRIREELRDD
ncbi:MAG TPA: sigma-70 family RNA polymerase sigma factor [Candidatus Limnocylindrales bacterium]|nr:sigma-70 family RNA polymerase sigma factor [Candidatus Limnocylindrales bacterium]